MEIDYKCKVECVKLQDVKLWTWVLGLNKCEVNTWCDITCVVIKQVASEILRRGGGVELRFYKLFPN